MTGSSDSDKIEPDRGNASGRLMFGGALIFAVLATLVLVFTTNAQWLKLAVIAALWAAFFGAMLSVKYRHQAAARAGEVADLQAVYELELEREVAARREYELEVEADTRRRIADETESSSREDVAALRAELRALRENLDRLTGGEVLVERIALRAQSTRMRALGESNLAARAITAEDDRRSITAGPATNPGRAAGYGPGRGPVRTVGAVVDPSTELLEPAPAPRQAQRQDNPRPDTVRAEVQRGEVQRGEVQRAEAQRGAAPRSGDQRRSGPARVPTPQTGEQSRNNVRREQINPPLPRQPGNTGTYAVPSQSGAYPLAGSSGAYPLPSHSGAYPVPGRPADADPASVPTRYAEPVARPTADGAHRAHRDSAHRDTAHRGPARGTAQGGTGYGASVTGGHAIGGQPTPAPSQTQHPSGQHPSGQHPSTQHHEDRPLSGQPSPARRDSGRRGPAQPYGGHVPSQNDSRYDDSGFDVSDFESGLGAEYDEDAYAHGTQGGRHTSGSYEPVPRPAAMSAASVPAYASAGARSSGRRAQPEPAGAHTAGRSVTELLAAHSPTEDSPRRHRRRAE